MDGKTGKTLLHVAWMSIVLGNLVEGAILIIATTFGKELEAKPILGKEQGGCRSAGEYPMISRIHFGATTPVMIGILFAASVLSSLQYEMEVQVVDLQVTVFDSSGNYPEKISPEDFVITEDGILQTPLDVEPNRQPFSIGILLDTSESMESMSLKIKKQPGILFILCNRRMNFS